MSRIGVSDHTIAVEEKQGGPGAKILLLDEPARNPAARQSRKHSPCSVPSGNAHLSWQ